MAATVMKNRQAGLGPAMKEWIAIAEREITL
jgi:hypothetical protein